MAFARPDYKLNEAIVLVKFMKGEIKELPSQIKDLTQDERDQLVLYLLNYKDDQLKELNTRCKEYQNVFNAMGKFIPHRGPTVYR
jgi:hypothetical protein